MVLSFLSPLVVSVGCGSGRDEESRGGRVPRLIQIRGSSEFAKVSLGSQDKFVSRILDLSRTQSCPLRQVIEAIY
jgi:hypothetical protein